MTNERRKTPPRCRNRQPASAPTTEINATAARPAARNLIATTLATGNAGNSRRPFDYAAADWVAAALTALWQRNYPVECGRGYYGPFANCERNWNPVGTNRAIPCQLCANFDPQRRFVLPQVIDLFGRGSRARTRDLRFWRPPLYQLSYTPGSRRRTFHKVAVNSRGGLHPSQPHARQAPAALRRWSGSRTQSALPSFSC